MSQKNIYKPIEEKKPKKQENQMEVDQQENDDNFDPNNPYKQIILSQNMNDEDV